jgi:hypothetical protein
LLTVTIIGLQAWFYNSRAAEIAEKTLSQEDRGTELGAMLYSQRQQLNDPAGYIRPASAPAATTASTTQTTSATASQASPRYHVPIDVAMEMVSRQYSEGSR